MYKRNSLKEISHEQLLLPSFYFKTIELPVLANYGQHKAPQKAEYMTLYSAEYGHHQAPHKT
jgi:hypothetical protein